MPETPLHRPPTAAELERARRTVAPLSSAVAEARRAAGPGALTLACFSDLHLHAPREYPLLGAYSTKIDATTNTMLAFTEMNALEQRPDLVVFAGDIADSGCPGEAPHDEYVEFQRLTDALLPADLPSLPVLGNHDHADVPMTPELHGALARHGRYDWPPSAGPLDFYFETRRAGWRFITLDSRQIQPLGTHQLQWLEQCFAADATTPTVVLVHRPWVTVGNWVDDFRQQHWSTFELLDRTPCVKAVLSGHTHKAAAWKYRQKTHVVFPSVAYGIGEPCGWGVVVLGADAVHSVFIKELTGTTYDHPSDASSARPGSFRRLPAENYIRSPLFNPCLMPM
jgi:3',5'-cyclic AMP phosphodiesterase CpdA